MNVRALVAFAVIFAAGCAANTHRCCCHSVGAHPRGSTCNVHSQTETMVSVDAAEVTVDEELAAAPCASNAKVSRRLHSKGAHLAHANPAPQPAQFVSRFHPLPTRPVFHRDQPLTAIEEIQLVPPGLLAPPPDHETVAPQLEVRTNRQSPAPGGVPRKGATVQAAWRDPPAQNPLRTATR